MDAKHTLGPWVIRGKKTVTGRYEIGQMALGLRPSVAAAWRIEDARLISAAPDMLEALWPFAAASKRFDDAATNFLHALAPDHVCPRCEFTHAELRRARAVLEKGTTT